MSPAEGFADAPLLRPSIVEALALMTGRDAASWGEALRSPGAGGALRVRASDLRGDVRVMASRLLSAGLLPSGEPRSDWWCPACRGGDAPPGDDPCAVCESRGDAGVAAPHASADLLAVASLGRETLSLAPGLAARVGLAEHGCEVGAVLWRVFTAADLRASAASVHQWGAPASTPATYAAAATAWELTPHIAHDHMPWWGYRTSSPNAPAPSEALVACYPALRELLLRDVHLAGSSPGRVVLGVLSPRARDMIRRRYE